MTYSIIAHCPATGRLGLGIATFSLAVGGRCEGVVANVAICKTQASPNRTNDPLAVKLLAEGMLPARVMQVLADNDEHHAYRQIAIMDREGRIETHTGPGVAAGPGMRSAPIAWRSAMVWPDLP